MIIKQEQLIMKQEVTKIKIKHNYIDSIKTGKN